MAKRVVLDKIAAACGLLHVPITKDMIMAVGNARQKYMSYLDEERSRKGREEVSRKRQCSAEEIEELKSKRQRLESDAATLITSADDYADKAEKASGLKEVRSLIAKGNSHRRSAKEKLSEAEKVQVCLQNWMK